MRNVDRQEEKCRRSNTLGSACGSQALFGGPPKSPKLRASFTHQRLRKPLQSGERMAPAVLVAESLAATNFFLNPRLLSGDVPLQHNTKKPTTSPHPKTPQPREPPPRKLMTKCPRSMAQRQEATNPTIDTADVPAQKAAPSAMNHCARSAVHEA